MKRCVVLIVFIVVVCSFSNSICADTVTLKLTAAGSTTQNGYRGGPVIGQVNGTPITMICNDFSHSVSVGQTWTATVSLFSDLSEARFSGLTGALSKYQQAAWLFDQISFNPAAAGDIQFAIWKIFTAATPTTTGSLSWINLATQQDLSNYDFSGFRVYTPTSGGKRSPQEFIAKIPGATVPEPATLLLLGSGLAGLASMMKKRNREQDSAND